MSASILVVDDDSTVRRSLVRLLTAHGYEVFSAANVAQAMQQLRERRPDVVVTDLNMPGVSGLDFARHMKADSDLRDVRIIAISGSVVAPRELEDLFVAFLQKPFASQLLLTAIEEHIIYGSRSE